MERGTRYFIASAARAALTANAKRPFAHSGYGAIASFAFGLPVSELPVHTATTFGASAIAGLARGSARTTLGKLGLGLTVGSAAALVQMHRATEDSERRVDVALADQLGADYRREMAPPPMTPRPHDIPMFPTPKVRAAYVEHGHISYGDAGARTTLDIWRRPDLDPDAKAPVLFQIHGGGWVTGDKEGQAYPLMVHMAERGWVCVSVTYRLSPRSKWPDHIVDVKQALAWVKDNIGDHGGDPGFVAVTGGSAGGHLTALTALTQNDPQFQPGFEDADTTVQAAVPFYGVYDWTNRDGTGTPDLPELLSDTVIGQTIADVPHVYDQASPMSHLHEPTVPIVPMMLLHGTNDTLVPVAQGRAMVDMLRVASDEPVVYVEFPGAQHAFDVFGSRRTRASIGGIERFLNVIRSRHLLRAGAPQGSSTT